MIGLGCSYSPALIELLDAGRARVDYVACSRLEPGRPGGARRRRVRRRPAGFLPGSTATAAEVEEFPWLWLNQLSREARTPWMAAPLLAPAKDRSRAGTTGTPNRVGCSPPHSGRSREIGDRLAVPLLLEPMPWTPGQPLGRFATHPSFVRRVAEQADLPLLLHLGRARAAAERLSLPITDYLRDLPLDRLASLRVPGVPGPGADGGERAAG